MTPHCLQTAVKPPALHRPPHLPQPSSPFSLCSSWKCLTPTSHTSVPLRYSAPPTARPIQASLNSYASFYIPAFFGKMRLAHLTNHISFEL